VLGSALGKNEGVVVDTHVSRLAPRLGLSTGDDPIKIEQDLMRLVPRDQWSIFAHRLIWHGRRVCRAKQPDCEHCTLAPLCPSAGLGSQPAAPASDTSARAAKPARAAPPPARSPGPKPAGKAAALAARAKPSKPRPTRERRA